MLQIRQYPESMKARCPEAEVPEYLEKIVARCLRKKPEERYQSMEELLADLKSASPQSNYHLADHPVQINLDGKSPFSAAVLRAVEPRVLAIIFLICCTGLAWLWISSVTPPATPAPTSQAAPANADQAADMFLRKWADGNISVTRSAGETELVHKRILELVDQQNYENAERLEHELLAPLIKNGNHDPWEMLRYARLLLLRGDTKTAEAFLMIVMQTNSHGTAAAKHAASSDMAFAAAMNHDWALSLIACHIALGRAGFGETSEDPDHKWAKEQVKKNALLTATAAMLMQNQKDICQSAQVVKIGHPFSNPNSSWWQEIKELSANNKVTRQDVIDALKSELSE